MFCQICFVVLQKLSLGFVPVIEHKALYMLHRHSTIDSYLPEKQVNFKRKIEAETCYKISENLMLLY